MRGFGHAAHFETVGHITLYVHVRRRGWGPEEAKDLTQQFFARFIERKYLQLADPERGRFRSFLLTSLKHFLADEWDKLRAQKRGGGQPAISWDGVDPENRYRDADDVEHMLPAPLIDELEQRLAAEGKLPAERPESPHQLTD